jgi:hypothetical protein
MEQQNHVNVTYHSMPDILEVVFNNNSTSAVDEYWVALEKYVKHLQAQDQLDQPIRIIIDITQSGLYSISYTIVRVKRSPLAVLNLPRTYIVYFTDDVKERFLIDRFSETPNTRAKDSRRVFSSREREIALKWLLSHDNA